MGSNQPIHRERSCWAHLENKPARLSPGPGGLEFKSVGNVVKLLKEFMSSSWLLVPLAGLMLCSACSSVVPPVGVAYAPVAPGANTPTIDSGTTPASAPPPSVAALDMAVVGVVHRALRSDRRLASAAQDISVSAHKGVVTLQGRVPTAQDREAILDQVSKLPCVDEVRDELAVNYNTRS